MLCGYLRTTIVDMALYFAPVESLLATLTELKRDRKVHTIVFGVLQELATHSSFQVRRYVAILYGVRTYESIFFIHVHVCVPIYYVDSFLTRTKKFFLTTFMCILCTSVSPELFLLCFFQSTSSVNFS